MPDAKLTEETALTAKRLLAAGVTIVAIGKLLGVSFGTVSKIKRGLIWKHVQVPRSGR